jgi:pimeloyl-ACP methyl ester carboxylesterase
VTKPHLLLLHGALGACSQFEPLSQLLSPHFIVHTFDFEGHGRAASRNRPFRIEHFAENIVEYLDEHRLPRTHIFGYSMGGYAALYLAHIHPDRVGNVATLATKFQWNSEVAEKESAALDPETLSKKLPKFAEALAQRHGNDRWKGVLMRTADMMLWRDHFFSISSRNSYFPLLLLQFFSIIESIIQIFLERYVYCS